MKWLSVDPGETVGWALWEDDKRLDAGQTPMWEFADDVQESLQERGGKFGDLQRLVIEDWAIYPKGVGPGPPPAWDKCLTARLIGALQFSARLAGIECFTQPASIKQAAIAAGAEDLFLTPRHENRHANDATMHGVFHIVTQGIGSGGS